MPSSRENDIILKTVAVGYGNVGKTCMYIRYHTGVFPDEYVPTVYDEGDNTSGEIDGKVYNLNCFDTGGGEDYDRLRPLIYPNTDVFLLLFDIAGSRKRFKEIYTYWWAELHEHCPEVPIILVGSKIDLRFKGQNGQTTIATAEGETMAKQIGAAKYMEISSLENEGVRELFKEAIKIGYDHVLKEKSKKDKRKCCEIL